MRLKHQAFALLPLLLVTATPAIAQPKPSPLPQTSPSLNLQQQQQLQQLQEEKRLQELIKQDLEESKVIGDRVQAEVDRAFSRTTTLLNVLLVVLTLFPILTVLGFWLLRRSVLSELLAEITKSGEEIKRETVDQISTAKQEIEQIASETKTQLEGMVSEAKQVLTALREQTAIAQTELESLSAEAKSKFDKAASDLQQQQERVTQLSQQLSNLLPASIQEPVAAENLPQVQAITTELETLQSANPKLTLTAADYVNQGNALFHEARYKEAIASYDKALELKQDYPDAWCNRGITLGNLQQYVEAIAAFDKALALKPDYHKAWYNKACCYGLQGKVELAVEQLREAINLNADYREKAKTDSDFDSIREDERFKQLLEG